MVIYNLIKWTAVDGATGYVVKIDGVDVIATSQKPTTGNNGDNEVDAGGKW